MILERDTDIEGRSAPHGTAPLHSEKIAELSRTLSADLEIPGWMASKHPAMIMKGEPLPVIVLARKSKKPPTPLFKSPPPLGASLLSTQKPERAAPSRTVASTAAEKIKVQRAAGGRSPSPILFLEVPPLPKALAPAVPPNRIIAIGISTVGPTRCSIDYANSRGFPRPSSCPEHARGLTDSSPAALR